MFFIRAWYEGEGGLCLLDIKRGPIVALLNYFFTSKKKSATAKLLISLGIMVATPGFEPGTPSL